MTMKKSDVLKSVAGVAAGGLAFIFISINAPSSAADLNSRTVYVAASGPNPGTGSATSPFVLTAGREYELNRVIRPILDGGNPVQVVVKDGVYKNVRLQIIRRGPDAQTIYLTPLSSSGQSVLSLHPGATCNRSRQNCRVIPEDYTLGADTTTPLQIVAEHEGKAIFDGSQTRDSRPSIESDALIVSGSIFGSPSGDLDRLRSKKIANVTVRGLTFRNYINGIHVQFATHVTIENCSVVSIGNRIPRQASQDHFGTYALRADGNSQLILFKGNTISDIWNVGAGFSGAIADPSLIHAIYEGYSDDIIFLDNLVSGVSGPLVKWGFYPIVRGGALYEYPSTPQNGRTVFINNRFVLRQIDDPDYGAVPIRGQEQAFIHENSRETVGGHGSSPAAGIIFLSNYFINSLPTNVLSSVAFLRQELPGSDDQPDFPGWVFEGNVITNVAPQELVIDRHRGTAIQLSSFRHGPNEQGVAHQLDLPAQDLPGNQKVATNWLSDLQTILSSSLKSSDEARDRLLLSVAAHGEVPLLH